MKRRCTKSTVMALKLIDDFGWQALIDEMSNLDEHEHEVSEHFSSTLAAALVSVGLLTFCGLCILSFSGFPRRAVAAG